MPRFLHLRHIMDTPSDLQCWACNTWAQTWLRIVSRARWSGEYGPVISHKPIGPDPGCLNIQYCTPDSSNTWAEGSSWLQCNAMQQHSSLFKVLAHFRERLKCQSTRSMVTISEGSWIKYQWRWSGYVLRIWPGQKGFNYKFLHHK